MRPAPVRPAKARPRWVPLCNRTDSINRADRPALPAKRKSPDQTRPEMQCIPADVGRGFDKPTRDAPGRHREKLRRNALASAQSGTANMFAAKHDGYRAK